MTRTTRDALGAIAVALLLVLAGCSGAVDAGNGPAVDTSGTDGADAGSTTDPAGEGSGAGSSTDGESTGYDNLAPGTVVRPGPTDPAEMDRLDGVDYIGWEAGYWHNDTTDVDLSDGLSEAEAGPYLARSMARVEYLRGVEFTREVTMVVTTEAEYRTQLEEYRRAEDSGDAARRAALDAHWAQVYEAAFVQGADETPPEGLGVFFEGFYNYDARIQFIQYDGDHPMGHPAGIHPYSFRETLVVHELVHALQDEFGSRAGQIRQTGTGSFDEIASSAALLEGEAVYLEVLYVEQCASGAWKCVVEPPAPPYLTEPTNRENRELAEIFLARYPYLEGVAFVDHVYTEGVSGRTGWEAIHYAHQNPPMATEQITHPERYPSEPVAAVSVPENSRNGWMPKFWSRLGERQLYMMFWYQDYEHEIPVIDSEDHFSDVESLSDRFVYESVPSTGWAGDRILTFARGEEDAYVWTIQFDSVGDAEEFHAAYLQVLAGHGGEQVGDYVWVIPDGQFADAFYVRQSGLQVTIVNAPTVEELGDVNPSVAALVDSGR